MITYRDLHTRAELEAVADLEMLIWGMTAREVVGAHLLFVLQHCGGSVIGAFDATTLVGFAVALIDATDPAAPRVWSHMAGVHPAYQRRGIGFALKQQQRRWALARGFSHMAWTFDPLLGRNANFNLRLLGATSNTYHINFYGEMTDGLNAGLPSDRLEMHWSLASARQTPRAATSDAPPTDAPSLLRCTDDAQPQPQPVRAYDQPIYYVGIPADVTHLKRTAPHQALAWRHALREALTAAFAHGYSATDFICQDALCWYDLRRDVP